MKLAFFVDQKQADEISSAMDKSEYTLHRGLFGKTLEAGNTDITLRTDINKVIIEVTA